MRGFLPFFIFIFALFLTKNTFAETLALWSIGTLDAKGQTKSEWNYWLVNPSFSGVGTPDAEIVLKFGGNTYTAVADMEGKWVFSVTAGFGDYNVEIMEGSNRLAFLLHLASKYAPTGGTIVDATAPATQPAVVPVTGFDQYMGIMLGAGVLLLASYFYVWGSDTRSRAFERQYINED